MVSEAEINPNLYFNASNLKDGVKERIDMTDVDDYLMNKENYQPKIKLSYLLECTSRLSHQKPSDYTTLCGKIIGQIVGDYLFDHQAVAKEMFNSAVGKIESCFDENQAVEAIHLAAMYGKFGSIRYICSSFSIEIKQSDLFECSLFLGKSISLSSFMMILIKVSLSKPLSELRMDPNWCFTDQNRFSAFYKTSTLQPVENRKEDFEKNPSRDTFSGKDSAHSNAFWLTHWSFRLGLHPMIAEMNSHLSQYLNQMTREIRNAERS